MTEKVTVLMPVGPNYNPEWLKEAIDSVFNQSVPADSIQIVLDGRFPFDIWSYIDPSNYRQQIHHVDWTGSSRYYGYDTTIPTIWVYRIPANIGFSATFNVGMSLAREELVVYLASDDKLMPTAVERAVQTYLDNNKKDAWYSYTYQSSSGDICSIPINAAMVTKTLWKMVGGYPPAGFVGPDALILSCLIAHAPDRIIKIAEGDPLYWFREHPDQETKTHTWKYVAEMTSIRGKYTEAFKFNE